MTARTHHQAMRDAKARASRRLFALARPELLRDCEPRVAAAGPVSMAVKTVDPETRALIDAGLASSRAPERPA